jgi:protein disulfide-isomerase
MSNRHWLPVLFSVVLGLGLQTISCGAESVSWRNNLDAAKIEAMQSGKLVLLHFYTSSCGPCKMLDTNVFSQPQIGEEIERNYVPVKINAEEYPALASSFRVERVPAEIVLNNQGNVVASLSCPQNATEYTMQLSNLADHYRQQTGGRTNANEAPVQAAYAGLQVGQYNNQPAAQTAPIQNQPVAQVPTVTNNPYLANANQANQQGYSPVASTAYGNPAMTAQQQPTMQAATQPVATQIAANPTMPANAMPNSYRDQSQAQPAANAPAMQPQVVTNPAAASQVNPASHISVTQQLPAGSPPLAFDGYCPVALKTNHKWVAGNLKFGAIHRGRTFLFMGEEQRQQFLANPDAYCPVFSGMDPVLLLDNNQLVEGSRRFGFEYLGAFYLFSNQESMNLFKSKPDQYAASVRQAMNRMDATNDATIRR